MIAAEASENLGYAGGVNSWLEHPSAMSGYTGFWVLNPDTAPQPDALAALLEACKRSGCGMAAGVLTEHGDPTRISTRGLLWRPWLGSVFSVDHNTDLKNATSASCRPIDAPSGASIYISRLCLEAIGPMNEDYFLYFEDLDWGIRAKAAGMLCGAENSIVPHKYGTTLGSAKERARRSTLSVFLEARNLVLFCKRHNPRLLAFAVLRSLVRVLEFRVVGSRENARASFSGLVSGLKGQIGRPPSGTAEGPSELRAVDSIVERIGRLPAGSIRVRHHPAFQRPGPTCSLRGAGRSAGLSARIVRNHCR